MSDSQSRDPRELLAEAASDSVGRALREELCANLANAFTHVGDRLWVGGSIIGGDRVAGESPFDFGSDATVGIATVAQLAGELTAAAVELLRQDKLYAAAALIRQLVEVEYLAWAFGSDQEESERWLRSTPADRRKMWQPRHLRTRSQGRFRGSDYEGHCERGGHPTPQAMTLLAGHTARGRAELWWVDLASHATSIWGYLNDAMTKVRWDDLVPAGELRASISSSIEQWETHDAVLKLLKERAWVATANNGGS